MLRELRNIIRAGIADIKRNKLDYAFLFFQFLVFVGAIRQFLPDNFLIFNLSLIVFITALRGKFQISSDLFFVTLGYIAIITIPLLTFDTNLRIYIGFYIRLLSGYFIIKYFGIKFIAYFENLVFLLAIISIPLFIMQLINPLFFNIFDFISKAFLTDVHLSVKPIPHKYLLIFLVNGWALHRNSGFAWEPAAFGAMLSWALLFNLFINKFVINKKAIILFIVALSTFSIGTYVYLLIISLLYLFEKSLKYATYLIVVSVVLFYLLRNVPVIQDNFNMMRDKTEMQPASVTKALAGGPSKSNSITRVAGFYVNWDYFVKWPWAYGFADNSGERRLLGLSSNGLMTMVARWGIPGIIIILLGAYKMIKILKNLYYPFLKTKGILIGMVIFILPFSGNPFHNRPLSLALILYGLIMSKYSKKNIILWKKFHPDNKEIFNNNQSLKQRKAI